MFSSQRRELVGSRGRETRNRGLLLPGAEERAFQHGPSRTLSQFRPSSAIRRFGDRNRGVGAHRGWTYSTNVVHGENIGATQEFTASRPGISCIARRTTPYLSFFNPQTFLSWPLLANYFRCTGIAGI